MPAGGALITAGVGALIGGGQMLYGNSQKKKYQRQLEALNSNMPKYQIGQEEMNMQNLAEARANQGMGAGAKAQLQNNADRNLATLSNSALMGGADANTIGGLVDKSQNAYNQNAMYDDQVRLKNLSDLQSSWARMSANKDKQWQINEYQPWKNNMTGIQAQLQGASNMQQAGMNMLTSSLMSAGGKAAGMAGGGAPEGNSSEFIGQVPYIGARQMEASSPTAIEDPHLQPVAVPSYTPQF